MNRSYLLVPSLVLAFLMGCTAGSNRTASELNLRLGLGYMEQGQMTRAKQKLLRALHQAPDWPPALNAMALYAEKTGDMNLAYRYHQKALAIAPEDGSVLNNYGVFLCRIGQRAKAETYFLRAAQNPAYLKPAEAYENASLCTDNQARARFYFEKARQHR